MENISKLTPILYDKGETNFNHNGLGKLTKLLVNEIDEVLNGEFEALFEYPANGHLADKIDNEMIIKAKPNKKDEPHVFKIYDYELDTFTQTYLIYARSKNIEDLRNNVILDVNVRGLAPTQAWNLAKNNALDPVVTTFYSDITTTSSVHWERRSLLSTIAGQEGSMIQYWGGEVKHDINRISLLRRRGQDNVTTVRHGKNLDGLKATYSTKGLVTAIVPYHVKDDGNAIYGDVVESEYINNYPSTYYDVIEYSVEELGLSQEGESEGGWEDSTIRTELNRVAKRYFDEHTGKDLPSINMEISLEDISQTKEYENFKDFEQIEIGDTITVYSKRFDLNINAKVRRVVYNGLTDKNELVEVGTARRSLYDDVRDEFKKVETELKEGIDHALISANGKNTNYYGTADPNEVGLVGQPNDTYFRTNGSEKEIWRFTGTLWELIMDTSETTKNADAIAGQQKDIDEAKQTADEAVDRINNEIVGKFTDIDQELLDIEAISNSAQSNAQTAINNSIDALGDASIALTNAQSALDQVDGAISSASDALSRANDAHDAATILSGQVSGFETTVAGFNQTVNNYEGQVSGFRNDISGLESTVASYESEVDEFGNTVSTYATEVSTMRNTVSGFESTVATYGTEVSGLTGEVVGYKNQVSTLNNTVDGFNSVVTQVQNDLGNIEIGGRNYIINSMGPFTSKTYPTHTFDLSQDIIVGETYTYQIKGVLKEGSTHWLFYGENAHPFGATLTREQYDEEKDIYYQTFVATSTTSKVSKVSIYSWPNTGGLNSSTIEWIKLEKGNKATDWSPAPEDMATSTQVSTLTNTVDGFQSKVDKVEQDYAGISGTVATHSTSISNLDGQIALKANTTTVDTLTGTVNTLSGRVDVTAGQISSKVWNTDIQTAVEDIEVGGRNLAHSENLRYNHGTLTSNSTKKISGNGRWFIDIQAGFLPNTTYTISNKKVINDGARGENLNVRMYNNAVSIPVQEIGNFSSGGITTFTTSSNVTETDRMLIYVSDGTTSGNFEIHEFKLEKGNKATDWTPAPEDTTVLISHVETELTQKHDAIEATVSSIRTDLTGTTTLLNTTKTTVDGHTSTIATLRTDVNGKATTAQFNTLNSTVNGTIQRVGNAEGKITTLETNVNGLQTTVASKAAQSQVTQLATGLSSVVTDLSNLEIGGRNLLKNSGTRHSNTGYPVAIYTLTEPIPDNSEVTISIKATLGRDRFGIYNSGGSVSPASIYPADKKNGVFRKTFKWRVGTSSNTAVNVYPMPNGTGTASTIEWIKLEYGNKATDWTPAPEDIQSQITQNANNINLRVAKGDVVSQLNIDAERTLISSSKILLNANTVSISGTAWMSGAVIANASIDGAKITDATISSAKIASLDVSKISGNTSNFVSTAWNNAAGGGVSVTGSGIRTVASNNSQTYIQDGIIGFRDDTAVSLGYIGYSQDSNAKYFSQTIANGRSFKLQYSNGQGGFEQVLEYTHYDDRLRARKLFLANSGIHMNVSNIEGVNRLYFNNGGYVLSQPTDSSMRFVSSRNFTFQTTSGVGVTSNALILDTTHAYMYRTLSMEGNNITNQSDERLKFNIEETNVNSLEEINSMTFVEFDRTNGNHDEIGVIAQDTPSLALYDSERDVWSINSSKQIMMNSHAIQQLYFEFDNRTESNESKIHQLQQELSKANRRIEELESVM